MSDSAEADAAMEVDPSAEQEPTNTEAADDIDIDSDADNDAILASNAAAPKSANSAVSSSSSSSMTAMDRLNALLQQTEQFSSFAKRDPASGSTSREASTRSHQTDKEKAEDSELVADELEEEEHSQPHFTRLTTQPSSVVGEMRDYQLEALNWLIRLHEQNINGILADEMGLGNNSSRTLNIAPTTRLVARSLDCFCILFAARGTGKTLESLSLLSYLKAYRNYPGPHLVVVPKSTSSNWLREIGRWTPNLTAYKFHGNQQEREAQKKVLGTHDVTITTYEMVIRERSALRKINWRYLCKSYHQHTLLYQRLLHLSPSLTA